MLILIGVILIALFCGLLFCNKNDVEYDSARQILINRTTGQIIKL